MEDIIMRVRHSKLLALIGAGILAVTALVACGNGDAATAQPSAVESSAAESTVAASSEVASTETTAGLSGSISMVGSTSMEKLANALSEAFMEEYPDVTVTAEFVGSGAGVEAVTNGTADIGNSSRSLKDEEKAAGVVENIVAIDGIAVCVDPANEVANLTKEQLTNIYNGTVTNWKEVGGDDAEIFVVSREESSGTRSAFEELIALEDAGGLTGAASVSEGNGPVQAAVAENANAIGYVSFSFIDDTVKALTVNDVEPTAELAKTGEYPLSRPFIFVYYDDTVTDAGKAFLDFALTEDGQACVDNHGGIRVK